MTRTIEPIFTDTEDLRFLKMTFAVHDSESSVVAPISTADFERIEDLTDEEIMRVAINKADALARLKGG